MASVTGSYTLKPRSYAGYISSGSFFDYFGGSAESDGINDSGPRGGWTNAFDSHSKKHMALKIYRTFHRFGK